MLVPTTPVADSAISSSVAAAGSAHLFARTSEAYKLGAVFLLLVFGVVLALPTHMVGRQRRDACAAHGFTLVECVTALAIIMVLAVGGATLVDRAVHAGQQAHVRTVATALAAAKMEELRALTWRFDREVDGGNPRVSDLVSDLTHAPPVAGGPGLRASPVDAATRNTPGYVDYVDALGRTVGTGPRPPKEAHYVRRWAVVPLASDPEDGLAFIVVVSTVVQQASSIDGSWNVTRLVSFRSRTQR
jgi:prepilin-type N-terminal cleavage/methylation domain-containing protein